MNFVDLSHSITNGMSTYPSDPEVILLKEKEIKTDNTLLHSIKMGTHTGTHLDVPAHIISQGKTLNDFPLTSFSGLTIKVDNNSYKQLKKLDNNINGVFYETGWYKYFDNPLKFYGSTRPIIPLSLIDSLINSKVSFFGCDLPSVDASGLKNKIIHKKLLNNDIIIYESLNNLDKISILSPFKFYGFPLSLHGLDGSPVRAVGIIK